MNRISRYFRETTPKRVWLHFALWLTFINTTFMVVSAAQSEAQLASEGNQFAELVWIAIPIGIIMWAPIFAVVALIPAFIASRMEPAT